MPQPDRPAHIREDALWDPEGGWYMPPFPSASPRDVHRGPGGVCPSCVRFGRHECAAHKDTALSALERIPTQPEGA